MLWCLKPLRKVTIVCNCIYCGNLNLLKSLVHSESKPYPNASNATEGKDSSSPGKSHQADKDVSHRPILDNVPHSLKNQRSIQINSISVLKDHKEYDQTVGTKPSPLRSKKLKKSSSLRLDHKPFESGL